MVDYKLTYFPFDGLAEPIRFLFKYGNIPFTDERITYEEWMQLKDKTPLGTLPILSVDSVEYVQSEAICRFVAGLVGLGGKDRLEDMEINCAVGKITDLWKIAKIWFYTTDEDYRAERREKVLNGDIPHYLGRLELELQEQGDYYACGKLTWADLYGVAIFDLLTFYCGSINLDKYPALEEHRRKVLSIPTLKKWMEERPKNDFGDLEKLTRFVRENCFLD